MTDPISDSLCAQIGLNVHFLTAGAISVPSHPAAALRSARPNDTEYLRSARRFGNADQTPH